MEFLFLGAVELFQYYTAAKAVERAARIMDNLANDQAPRLGDVAGVALAFAGADIDILPDRAIDEAAHVASNVTTELIDAAPEAVVRETAGAAAQAAVMAEYNWAEEALLNNGFEKKTLDFVGEAAEIAAQLSLEDMEATKPLLKQALSFAYGKGFDALENIAFLGVIDMLEGKRRGSTTEKAFAAVLEPFVQRCILSFNKIDYNGDGKISSDELQFGLFSNQGASDEEDIEDAKSFFRQADLNNDGSIDRGEWVQAMFYIHLEKLDYCVRCNKKVANSKNQCPSAPSGQTHWIKRSKNRQCGCGKAAVNIVPFNSYCDICDSSIDLWEKCVTCRKCDFDACITCEGKDTFDGPPTVNVQFCDSDLKNKLGDSTRIPKESIRKCRSSEFLQVGDVIRAKEDLTWDSGTRINKGTLGEIKERDDSNKDDLWLIHWWDDNGAKKSAYSHHIKKCKPSEFFMVGDWVKAKHDLTSTQGVRISKGTLGKLKELRSSDGHWLVKWNSAGNIHTAQSNIKKCAQSEFISVGDIVKATYQLKWQSGVTVEKGSLGKLKQMMEDDTWLVEWYGNVGEKQTTEDGFSKCEPSEYFVKDDVMALVHDLTFDNGKIRVPKGTLCTYL